ncbi:MAG: LD-carboxypeptidase [Bacilli bacterium]|nr:LD-carboxypeptidase [Bacilli bacterium]
MLYPKYLKINDTIGVPAPSDGAYDEAHINRYKYSSNFFENKNYKLELSKNINKSTMARSADKKERGKELNEMFKSKDIDFILCASGGEFLVECLPYIDFNLIKENPKFVAGFSDPTGILFPITTKYDIATIYGNNFSSFGREKLSKSHYDFLDLIEGKKLSFESYPLYEEERPKTITGLESYNLTEKVEWKTLNNKDIKIEGRIIGGCIDIISELIGTKYDGMKEFNEKYKDDGIIWYFDNCELSMEEIIRVLWKMNEFDYFKYCKGVIFGRFGVNSSWVGYDLKSCLKDSILIDLNIPIIYDADISHKPECLPILNGSIATIECTKNKGTISFELK